MNFDSMTALCSHCGLWCPMSECRITGKSEPKAKCNHCQTTQVQCGRGLGTWPHKEFLSLPESLQQEFSRKAKKMAGGAAVDLAVRMMESHSLREQVFEEGGSFLPLTVWANKGYDTQAIESLTQASDKQVHPILGECYRVSIMKRIVRGIDGYKTNDSHNLKGRAAATENIAERNEGGR